LVALDDTIQIFKKWFRTQKLEALGGPFRLIVGQTAYFSASKIQGFISELVGHVSDPVLFFE
jgi:hypothetical protein